MTLPFSPAISRQIENIRETAPREYATWNADLFERYTIVEGARLWQSLGETFMGEPAPTAEIAMDAWFVLVREGIAAGYLTGHTAANFIEYALATLVPKRLAQLPPEAQLPALAAVWNIGEGLRREPEWLERYVMARAIKSADLATLAEFVIGALEPVLTPAPPAKWGGPFTQTRVNLRATDEAFLPGEMTVSGPRLITVRDRRRPVNIGVLLAANGTAEVLGTMGDIPADPTLHTGPAATARADTITVAGHHIKLPLVTGVHRWLTTAAGFVVAIAADSQHLWIAHTP